MEKLKNLPSLRFPEFAGNWDNRKIKEILTIGSGKDYKHLDLGDVPVFGTGGLMTMVNSYLYDGETVCIGRKGTIDKPMYFNGKIWTVDTLFYTHSFRESNPKFVFNLFQRVNWKQHNEAGGVPSLSKSTIEQISLNLPSIKEQTKIATFLTAVDDKLQALKQKKTLLEQYKKGVMQKIFSQELRFKDDNGNEYPDWEVKKLEEVIQIQGGYAFKSNLFNQGQTKVIRIGNIEPNIFLESFDGVYSKETPGLKYIAKKGDFLMALSGATFGKVGKIKDDGIGYINQRVALFKTKENLEYYYQLVQTDNFRNYINSIPTASAQPNISNGDILNFESLIPCIEEQTKIANFLSAIEDKINHCQSQIEKIEVWKKGLLQQMFV